MLLIDTKLKTSPIHGLGLFTTQSVSFDQPVWEFTPGLDRIVTSSEFKLLPLRSQQHVRKYGFLVGCDWVLCVDDARFMNHSHEPTLHGPLQYDVAKRPLMMGDELTCDYRTFDDDWREKLQ